MSAEQPTHATELSDAFHRVFCTRGHAMDQCGYGFAGYDDYRETRLWRMRAEAWLADIPLTERQAIEALRAVPPVMQLDIGFGGHGWARPTR